MSYLSTVIVLEYGLYLCWCLRECQCDNDMISDELIFRKYDIDSAQFYNSELYYSRNPKIHFKIYSNVKRRIQKSIDSLKNIK